MSLLTGSSITGSAPEWWSKQPRIECHGARSFPQIPSGFGVEGRRPQVIDRDAGAQAAGHRLNYLFDHIRFTYIIGDTKGGGYPLP